MKAEQTALPIDPRERIADDSDGAAARRVLARIHDAGEVVAWQALRRSAHQAVRAHLIETPADPEKFTSHPTWPQFAVTWYEAAWYCNWLSVKARIPEDQWDYPDSIGAGMVLPADYLERTGYRLPTEQECEFAARAGAPRLARGIPTPGSQGQRGFPGRTDAKKLG